MSDPQSTNHWKELADQIGAEVADEPKEAEPDVATEGSDEGEAADKSRLDGEESFAPKVESQVGPSFSTAEKKCSVGGDADRSAEDDESVLPGAGLRADGESHWRRLASELGIELPEPEVEPEPEPQPEPEPVSAATVELEPEQPSQPVAESEALEPSSQAELGASWGLDVPETQQALQDGWQGKGGRGMENPETPRAESQALQDQIEESHEGPKSGPRTPLFEDPDLSLETPGVLDAIFEEEEEDIESRQDDFSAIAAPGESEGETSVTEEEPESHPSVGEVQEGGVEEEFDEKRGKRRRRRRRRRPSRKDHGESSGDTAESKHEADAPSTEDRASANDDGKEAAFSKRPDKAEAAKLKHRKIPTWEEAIDIVISANKEARAKASNSGARGKRRGRK